MATATPRLQMKSSQTPILTWQIRVNSAIIAPPPGCELIGHRASSSAAPCCGQFPWICVARWRRAGWAIPGRTIYVSQECTVEHAGVHLTEVNVTPAEKRLILSALIVVILLSALDQTIVSTAMPRIIEQLQGLKMYAWVTTAYMLTSTVTVPIYGKLGDMYGRKPILIVGVLVFLAGSALCGLAGEFGRLPLLGDGMMQLIVFRALQGLGAGALMTVVFAIIADLYTPRERGRMFGVFGSVFGIATIIGPFIGGFFTDHGSTTLLGYTIAGWRWIFYVNLPLGLFALFLIVYRLPAMRHRGAGRIDYLGAALLVTAFTPFLLALSLGGTTYPWGATRMLGLFAVAVAALLVFLWVESRTQDAILPLHLFRIQTFRVAILAQFVINMAFLGVVMFMPLFMQVVQGITATHSGVAITSMMVGQIISSTTCGRLVTRTGRYKQYMIGGGVLLAIGIGLLTHIGPDTTTGELAWRLAIVGVGLGPAQSLFSMVITNSVPVSDIGVASSTSQFSRQIGSTLGLAIFGTLLTHSLTIELPKHVPQLPGAAQQIDLDHAQRQAMSIDRIRSSVDAAMTEHYPLIERAYRGDAGAVAAVLSDARLPEPVKTPVRDGGIRTRVHDELVKRATTIQKGLQQGASGRAGLLVDTTLSAQMRQDLANIPSRAFQDPQTVASTADLFRDSLLDREDALVAARTDAALGRVRSALNAYSQKLVNRIQYGTREAFSASITQMFSCALWIVLLGTFITLFIPELPLRSRAAPSEPVKA